LPQNSNAPTMCLNTLRFQTSMPMGAQMGAKKNLLFKQHGTIYIYSKKHLCHAWHQVNDRAQRDRF